MANKPSIPKGTRDFSPDEMVRRNYIFDTIRSVFKKYGYQPIETPAMENIESLTGKYGDEGDQLLFKILNSRPYEAKDSDKQKMREAFDRTLNQNTNSADLTERALRYDLTVPFARYVVQHQNEITFPFKRYQIQPVWRADRPQKGRYREFYQCDADVIGSNSLINEVELVQMVDEVFTALKVPVTIKINNRKILQGIADYCGCPDKLIDLAVAIDKIDKIGKENVVKELLEKNISSERVDKILRCLFPEKSDLVTLSKEQLEKFGFSNSEIEARLTLQSEQSLFHNDIITLECLETTFWEINDDGTEKKHETGLLGCRELLNVFALVGSLGLKTAKLEFDTTLARGLNYYTGAIFEVKANAGTLTSSITGGGRYDDLTGVFGLPNVSGVGISFGADRIYDVLNELNLYPESVTAGSRLLFINKGGKSETISLQLLKKIREKNIAAEIYPDNVKWEKQAKYVDAKKIPFTATVDENTFEADGKISLKYQIHGKWQTENISLEELVNKIS